MSKWSHDLGALDGYILALDGEIGSLDGDSRANSADDGSPPTWRATIFLLEEQR
jgi:hypothetical protein